MLHKSTKTSAVDQNDTRRESISSFGSDVLERDQGYDDCAVGEELTIRSSLPRHIICFAPMHQMVLGQPHSRIA